MSKLPSYTVVEGNIGAGKTSLTQQLAKDWEAQLVLERFADNPFLPSFYTTPERYALPVELFFMSERHEQLQRSRSDTNSFPMVADYLFHKTLLFAQKNLKGEERALFERLFYALDATFPAPDLLVYLHRPIDQLLQNIKHRGRPYEQQISADYLQQLEEAYSQYFAAHQDQLTVLVLELEDLDFLAEPNHYQRLRYLLEQPYAQGYHRRSVQDILAVALP